MNFEKLDIALYPWILSCKIYIWLIRTPLLPLIDDVPEMKRAFTDSNVQKYSDRQVHASIQ